MNREKLAKDVKNRKKLGAKDFEELEHKRIS